MADAEWQCRAKTEAERQCSGKKRRGREHGLIAETPADKAQTNFTDAELSVLPTAKSPTIARGRGMRKAPPRGPST